MPESRQYAAITTSSDVGMSSLCAKGDSVAGMNPATLVALGDFPGQLEGFYAEVPAAFSNTNPLQH
jgi:hypothetical protein